MAKGQTAAEKAEKARRDAAAMDYDAPRTFTELPPGPWERMVPCVICLMRGVERLIMNRQGPEHDQEVVCGREHWIVLEKVMGRAGPGIDEWWEMTLRAAAGKTEGDGGVDRSGWHSAFPEKGEGG